MFFELYFGNEGTHLTKLLILIQTHDSDQNWFSSEPALEPHSRAASSVGVTSPFQRSQHRKQFQRKVDKKWDFTAKDYLYNVACFYNEIKLAILQKKVFL